MRLFAVLMGVKQGRIPGSLYRGKKRIVKQVSGADRQKLVNYYDIEEENMFYLRHAYLTPEQSHGHARELGKPEQRTYEITCVKGKFKDDVTIENRLGHLRHAESWD